MRQSPRNKVADGESAQQPLSDLIFCDLRKQGECTHKHAHEQRSVLCNHWRGRAKVVTKTEDPDQLRPPLGMSWENWCDPVTGEWERTFAVITVPSNELVGQIHNRMPAILEPESYERWLGLEPDPHDLLITYPSEAMTMWPISTRVNKPENDDPSILDGAAEPVDWQAPLDDLITSEARR
jgi:hypothetical protein